VAGDQWQGIVQIEDVLVRAARLLTSSLDENAICDAVCDAIDELYGPRTSWVLLLDPAGERLVLTRIAGVGGAQYPAGYSIPANVGPIGRAMADQVPLYDPDVNAMGGWQDPKWIEAAGIRSLFGFPLVLGGRSIGMVGLDWRGAGRSDPPVERDYQVLEAFAAQASMALGNARTHRLVDDERARCEALLRERDRLDTQVRGLRAAAQSGDAGSGGRMVGTSAALRQVLVQAERVAASTATVLLRGETGTGKELLARLIHERSRRAAAPFIAVNCPAIPDALVESELFGHERGAFTGATERTVGSFEAANRGTILLDEIGDLPPGVQAKLLRTLQDGSVQRVGGSRPVRVDVRVIAATNRDLEAAVAANEFRSDLYYRLNVFPIVLPPLRDRHEDIVPLFTHFVEQAAARLHGHVPKIDPAVLKRLEAYDWPGNIRELQNAAERAVILSPGPVISPCVVTLGGPVCASRGDETVTFAEAERRAIRGALEATGWRISGPNGAAARLGLRPTTLHAKMRKLGVTRMITPLARSPRTPVAATDGRPAS